MSSRPSIAPGRTERDLLTKHEIIEKLAIIEQFAHNARHTCVPLQAVADGYSSIDARLSAVPLDLSMKC